MKLYKLKQDFERYQYLFVSNDEDADGFLDLGKGPVSANWKIPEMEIDRACRKQKPGDFWQFGSPPLIVNERAQRVLAELLGEHVEFLPLKFQDQRMYVMNVLHIIDCIDRAASGWGEREFRYENPVFIPEQIGAAPIFIWSGNPFLCFAQQSFKDCVEQHGLLGLNFIEVPVQGLGG